MEKYKKINDCKTLLDVVRLEEQILLVGTGWIAMLVRCYVEKYTQIKLKFVDKRDLIELKNYYSAIIIAEQEDRGG